MTLCPWSSQSDSYSGAIVSIYWNRPRRRFCPDSCRKVKGVFSREAVENKAGISSLEVSARGGYAMRKTSTAMDLRQEPPV